MELFPVSLVAGQTQQFAKPGRYFEIIDSTGPIQIDFTGPNGNMTDNVRGALSGLFLEGAYSHFALTSATTQTVNLLIMETGRGGSRRQPGNVRVIDEILDSITYTSVNLPTAIAAMNWVAIVAPASNVRGVIVRGYSCGLVSGAGGGGSIQIAAAKSLPVGFTLPAQKFVFAGVSASNGATITAADSKLNKFLPPGWGVYAGEEVTAVAASGVNYSFNYELL